MLSRAVADELKIASETNEQGGCTVTAVFLFSCFPNLVVWAVYTHGMDMLPH